MEEDIRPITLMIPGGGASAAGMNNLNGSSSSTMMSRGGGQHNSSAVASILSLSPPLYPSLFADEDYPFSAVGGRGEDGGLMGGDGGGPEGMMEMGRMRWAACWEIPQWLEAEFIIVVCCGGTTSFFSLINNFILLLVFLLSKSQMWRNYFFLTCLAGFDILMALFYFILMIVRVLSEYMQLAQLNNAWYSYVTPVFTISHVIMTSSACLVVFATSERYVGANSYNKFPYPQRRRSLLAIIAIFVGVAIKGCLYFEFKVEQMTDVEPNCTRERFTIAYTDLANNPNYNSIWMFWFRNITVTFLPFFILCYLNIGIVITLRRQTSHHIQTNIILCPDGYSHHQSQNLSGNERRVKAATRMLILVSMSYLGANILNVAVTAWEHIDPESLLQYQKMYHLCAAVVSLLTILAGAVRLPSYCWCNSELRHEVRLFICGGGGGGYGSRRWGRWGRHGQSNSSGAAGAAQNGRGQQQQNNITTDSIHQRLTFSKDSAATVGNNGGGQQRRGEGGNNDEREQEEGDGFLADYRWQSTEFEPITAATGGGVCGVGFIMLNDSSRSSNKNVTESESLDTTARGGGGGGCFSGGGGGGGGGGGSRHYHNHNHNNHHKQINGHIHSENTSDSGLQTIATLSDHEDDIML